MTRQELLKKLAVIYFDSDNHSTTGYTCVIRQHLYFKWLAWDTEGTWNDPIPKKVKFVCKFPLKDIRVVFNELGLIVTHYTNEYGKSIVYFKPISHSTT